MVNSASLVRLFLVVSVALLTLLSLTRCGQSYSPPSQTNNSPPQTYYSLSTWVIPSGGGSVSPSAGTYVSGTLITLTAVAAPGYRFVSWSGDASGTSTMTTITMNSNEHVIATFASESSGTSGQVLANPPVTSEQKKLYITPNDAQVRAVVNDVVNRQLRIFTDFEALRDWVSSHISYCSDQEVHGVSEYWQLPNETLQRGTGDCEDFAILLCSLLRAYGVPSDQLYVAIGYSADKTSGHAYLAEKWYKGIWEVIESEAPALTGILLSDWLTSVSYETAYCFNDQNYIQGLPKLPSGTYEFELSLLGSASAVFERNLNTGQQVKGSVEWLGKQGQQPPGFPIFGWGLKVYDPNERIAFSWFGGDLEYSFSYTAQTSGVHKVEVYLGFIPVVPLPGQITLDPLDWN